MLGETGTSKTASMKRFVDTLTKDIWDKGSMIFSATTNSTQTADYLLDNVTKRTKGQYGPIVGWKFIVMIDDINMPVKEKYGA